MICFRSEEDQDLIPGENVNTLDDNFVVNFEVFSANSFQDIKKNQFMTVAVAEMEDSNKQCCDGNRTETETAVFL